MANNKILIADDDINVIAGLQFLLNSEGYDTVTVTTPEAAKSHVAEQQFDCALLDMNFQQDTTSGNEGVALVAELCELDGNLPMIAMTGWATIDVAVAAMQAGAKDFIQKPWSNERLLHAIKLQIALASSTQIATSLSQQNKLLTRDHYPDNRQGIVAKSAVMQSLLTTLEELAQSDMSILLTGDNGTGKSMLAGYVHSISPRAEQSFVPVNMGAIPESLFESEMFGHIKGAFTDAKENRVGRFEMADKGTLFLDEVANIPMAQQAKLLRVLEERSYEPVGSSRAKQANVRLISATNSDLDTDIQENRFRQDLYYRINTIELRVPSLAERVEDIAILAEHFLQQFSAKYHRQPPKLTASALQKLEQYTWPGNIRELSHLMERVLFTCKNGLVDVADLRLTNAEQVSERLDDPNLTLVDVEQRVLEKRLQYYGGNASETAKSLGLSRSGYYRRLAKYNMEP